MTPAFNVLFLCTHNSARSIMAEAILQQDRRRPVPRLFRRIRPDRRADARGDRRSCGRSATTSAALRSKSWDEFTGPNAPRMDFVIALCDTLDGQVCPDFGELAVTGAWPLPDPAKFTGSAAERATLLNELYASLRRRIEIFTACRSPRSTAWR